MKMIEACLRKEYHATSGAATLHMKNLVASGEAKDPNRLMIYPCEFCDGWHVGHMKEKQYHRMRKRGQRLNKYKK